MKSYRGVPALQETFAGSGATTDPDGYVLAEVGAQDDDSTRPDGAGNEALVSHTVTAHDLEKCEQDNLGVECE